MGAAREGDREQRDSATAAFTPERPTWPRFRARLVSLEQAHHVLRAELRADMKELQQ